VEPRAGKAEQEGWLTREARWITRTTLRAVREPAPRGPEVSGVAEVETRGFGAREVEVTGFGEVVAVGCDLCCPWSH